jgi:hypothetical protein
MSESNRMPRQVDAEECHEGERLFRERRTPAALEVWAWSVLQHHGVADMDIVRCSGDLNALATIGIGVARREPGHDAPVHRWLKTVGMLAMYGASDESFAELDRRL